MGYEKMQALSSGNELLFERLNLKNEVAKLERAEVRHGRQKLRLQDEIKRGENRAELLIGRLQRMESDRDHYTTVKDQDFSYTDNKGFTRDTRETAGTAMRTAWNQFKDYTGVYDLGEYRGFQVKLEVQAPLYQGAEYRRTMYLEREERHEFAPDALNSENPHNVFLSMDSNLRYIKTYIDDVVQKEIERNSRALEQLRQDITRPWKDSDKLRKKRARLAVVEEVLEKPESAIDEAQKEADERPEADFLGSMGGNILSQRTPLREDEVVGAVPSLRPEVAQRLEKALGATRESKIEKFKRVVGEGLNKSTRAQEFIPNNARFASTNEFFRLLKAVRNAKEDETARIVGAIIDPMGGGAQRRIFELKTIVDNQLASIERGEPLRFGFKSIDEVRRVKTDLDTLVEKNPQIQGALKTRREIVREIVSDLVAHDLLEPVAFKNADTYFHQQVLNKLQLDRAFGIAQARPIQRSFQKSRVTGVKELKRVTHFRT